MSPITIATKKFWSCTLSEDCFISMEYVAAMLFVIGGQTYAGGVASIGMTLMPSLVKSVGCIISL